MDQLRKEGWSINESQTAEFFPDGILPKTSNEILKVILDEDLREFGEASIINRKEDHQFEGPCVVQLLRYRNVSVPRIKEEMNQADPTSSIVRLFLTDGHTSISAIVLDPIPGINADTPPGTKILLSGKIAVEGIFLVITKKDVKILGGRVGELIEKWNVEKNSVRADGFKTKSGAGKGSGAPKWVSFGKRGQKNAQLEKDFKANSVMPKTIKEGDDADEFAKNREQVIKEIETDTAKTFAKPNLAPPPPKEKTIAVPKEPKERKPREFKKRGRKNSEDGPDIDVGEYANHKPSGGVTLFDFIGGNSASSEVAKLAEETSRLKVAEKKSFEDRGPGRKPQNGPRDRNSGRNDTRPNRDQQSSFSGQNNTPRQQDRPSHPPSQQTGRNDFRKGQTPRDHQNAQKDDRKGSNRAPVDTKRGPPQQQKGSGRGPPQESQNAPNDVGSRQPTQNQRQNNARRGPPNQGSQQNDFRRGPPQQEPQNAPNDFRSRPSTQNQRQNDARRGPPHHGSQQNDFRRGPPQQEPHNGPNDFRRQAPPQDQRQNDFRRGPPHQSSHQNEFRRGPPQQDAPNFQPNFNRTSNDFRRGPPPQFQSQQNHGPLWQIGSQCLATWTDGAIYPATIVNMLPDRMCVVRYNEYGNTHSLPVDFLIMP